MEFNRLLFIMVYLPIVIGLFVLCKKNAVRNGIMLLSSLVFYALGDFSHLWVLLLLIGITYLFGRLVETKRKLYPLYLCVVVGILCIFKYGTYLTEHFSAYFRSLDPFAILMPLGISFFTFTSISYVSDVYYGKIKAEKNLLPVAMYLSFFPTVISGPIMRYETIRDWYKKKEINADSIANGLRRFIIGLSQKVIFANQLNQVSTAILIDQSKTSFLLGAYGVIAFAIQEFYDFAGYSNMAIGIGQMIGVSIPENFDAPYFSESISEYWRRWHITLGAFFKDYVYIPLGGNRKGSFRKFINNMIVFVISGIWHGATFAFVLWGIINGIFVAVRSVAGGFYASVREKLHISEDARWFKTFRILRTDAIEFLLSAFVFKCVTREQRSVLFRALTLRGSRFSMFYTRQLGVLGYLPLLLVAIVFLFPQWRKLWKKLEKNSGVLGDIILLVLLAVCIVLIVSGSFSSFIYFNF